MSERGCMTAVKMQYYRGKVHEHFQYASHIATSWTEQCEFAPPKSGIWPVITLKRGDRHRGCSYTPIWIGGKEYSCQLDRAFAPFDLVQLGGYCYWLLLVPIDLNPGSR